MKRSLAPIIRQLPALLLVGLSFVVVVVADNSSTNSSWKQLDERPLPSWYDHAKFGIFLHWGVFSVPSIGSEWFWNRWRSSEEEHPEFADFVAKTERPGFTYPEYASRFKAELYRPDEWAQLFAESGAQYVVLTSKHHEGYCMWNSSASVPSTWNWNVMDIGPQRDLLGDLATAVRKQRSKQTNLSLRFGAYHSLYEWYNPLYLQDKKANTTTFVDTKTIPELYDLVQRYNPDVIWSDGDWETTSDYWKATEFLSWYATQNPDAVWNDRWGRDATCKHGSFLTCHDDYQPDTLLSRKWEDCMTMDASGSSWGLNRNNTWNYWTVKDLIHRLIKTISKNGNLLLNIGPAADGTLHPIFVDRLQGIGQWLSVNGAAVYGTRPWWNAECNETAAGVYYTTTTNDNSLFVHLTQWPRNSRLRLLCPQPTSRTRIRMLGLPDEEIAVQQQQRQLTTGDSGGMMIIELPHLTPDRIPCQHAWVLQVTGLANHHL